MFGTEKDATINDVTEYLNTVLHAYAETALWTEHVCGCGEVPCGNQQRLQELLDRDGVVCPMSLREAGFPDLRFIDGTAVTAMEVDVVDFVMGNWDDVNELDPEMVGHDFWLTRNRHGAGFWDRGLDVLGDRLTAAAHAYGEASLMLGDDGKVHYYG